MQLLSSRNKAKAKAFVLAPSVGLRLQRRRQPGKKKIRKTFAAAEVGEKIAPRKVFALGTTSDVLDAPSRWPVNRSRPWVPRG